MSSTPPSEDSSRDLSRPLVDCPLNHCQILVTVKDTARANVADVTIDAGGQSKATVLGRAQFDDLHAGMLTVTATLAGETKKACAWAADGAAKVPLNDTETLAKSISPDASTIFGFTVVKLARPTVKVVRDDNAALLAGVGVTIESGGVVHDLGDTQADGVASLAGGSRGLIPLTTYVVKLAFKGLMRDAYKIIDPGMQNIAAGSTAEITVRASFLARPTVKVVRDDNSALLAGVGVKIEAVGQVHDLVDTGVDGVASLAPGSGLVARTDYVIKLDFKGATQDKYKIVDPGAQNIAAGSTAEITVRATCLARPTIKVVREDNNKPIPDIDIDLTLAPKTYKYDSTNELGVGNPMSIERMLPGNYTVTATLGVLGTKLYRYAGPATIAVTPGFEGELQIQLRPKGSLLVEVSRYDGVALHGRVTFNLTTGPSAQAGLATAAPALTVPPNIDFLKIDNLDFGDYEVVLQGIAAIEQQGGSTRDWKIGPDSTGTIKVKIEGPETERQLTTGEKTAHASFVLSKYTHAQPIAFNIRPTTRETAGVMRYIGSDDAAKDIEKRCAIMIAAIKAAAADTNIDARDSVLKIFMAPEFYFRGTAGAYPFEDVSKVLSNAELQAEIVKVAYKDWLFVLGSAIGYLDHGRTGPRTSHVLNITAVGTTGGGHTKVTVVKGKTEVAPCAGILNAATQYRWTLKKGATEAFVAKSTRLDGTTFELELNAVAAFVRGEVELMEPDERENRFLLRIKTVTSATSIRVERAYDKVSVCSRISRSPKNVWNVFQRGIKLPIAARTRISDTEFQLDLDAPGGVLHAEPFYLLEPATTEVLNAAFVKKGGPDPAPQTSFVRKGGLRELLVYKEYVSPIDFITPSGGTRGLDVVLHGNEQVVLPTAGSQGTRGQDTNLTSEVNKTGLGGGTVFTVDGVNFGLEVCLDHAKGRLHDHRAAARHGEPRVQVQLIPSWGMTIGNSIAGKDAVACVANGLVFNVDGARCDSAFRVNDGRWGCDKHLTIAAAAGGTCTATCPEPLDRPAYKCATNHWGFDSPCKACGNVATAQPNRNGCSNGHIGTGTGTCGRVCGAALVQMGTGSASIAGPLEVSLSGTSWISVTTSNYFEKKGSILIYPATALPAARTF